MLSFDYLHHILIGPQGRTVRVRDCSSPASEIECIGATKRLCHGNATSGSKSNSSFHHYWINDEAMRLSCCCWEARLCISVIRSFKNDRFRSNPKIFLEEFKNVWFEGFFFQKRPFIPFHSSMFYFLYVLIFKFLSYQRFVFRSLAIYST